MAAKEKGKIVSASPDSPTLEKLSTFSQQIRSALHCFSAVATRTNALWQRIDCKSVSDSLWSQPARMRCGKERHHLPSQAVLSSQPARMRCGKELIAAKAEDSCRRNPHECAVAKKRVIPAFKCEAGRNPHECAVAKSRIRAER